MSRKSRLTATAATPLGASGQIVDRGDDLQVECLTGFAHRRVLLVLSALSLVLAGCAAGLPTTKGPASAPATVVVPTDRWLEPLESMSTLADQDKAVLFAATQRATADCMREKGFVYLPEDYVAAPPLVRHVGDVEFAEEWGYATNLDGTDATLPSSARVYKNDSLQMSDVQQAAWNVAYGGAPIENEDDPDVVRIDSPLGFGLFRTSSCVARAETQVYGDVAAWRRLDSQRQDLANASGTAADADPEYLAAVQEWSSCMSTQGYRYADRTAPWDDLFDRAREQRWSQAEFDKVARPVAVADARCAQQVDLIKAHNAAILEHDAQVVQENQAVVKQFLDMRAQAIEKARQI